MSFKEGFTKALYISVGAIAVGAEMLGEALDNFSAKGGEVVEKSKTMFKEYCAARKAACDEEPEVVIEEDTGDNAPVAGE